MHDSVGELFALSGTAISTGGDDPLPLIDPGAVWLVTRGHVDIVAMTITAEAGASDMLRTHLLRVPAGQLLFGFHAPPEGCNVLLLGFGTADVVVSRLAMSRLAHAATSDAMVAEDLQKRVDRWITSICELCADEAAPTGMENIRAGVRCEIEAGHSAQPQSGVLWVRPIEGSARFLSGGPRAIVGDVRFPVGRDAWVTAEESCTLESESSGAIELDDAYWRGLDAFHTTIETVINIQHRRQLVETRRRLAAKSEADHSALERAFASLESILNGRLARPARETGEEEELLAACRLVGEKLGIDIRRPGRTARADLTNPLEDISRFSRFALRRVRLEKGWHTRDGGPLLGFRGGGAEPVALLPASPTSYEAHLVREGRVEPVRAAFAQSLDAVAFTFYRCLPDRPLKGLDLVRFASRGIRRDLAQLVLMGACGGLLTLASPIAVGHAFDTIIPGAERMQLLQVTIGLAVAAIAIAAFQATRTIALVRLQHRAGTALQAAIWERVVNLPARFFADYSAGDLGLRAMGIDSIMQTLSTTAITTVVSSVFSLLSLIVLFWYSPAAALVAVGLVAVVLLATVGTGARQAKYQWEIEALHGKITGTLLQFIKGISKIRVAAAESRAFAQWAARFAELTRLTLRGRFLANRLGVFYATYPVLTYVVLFLLVAPDGGEGVRLTTGGFLAFIAAYATLLYGMVELGDTAVDLLSVVPTYLRLKPILQATPEVDPAKAEPGVLRGRIEVSNLSFRYEREGPPILHDVSFRADPGEFVAIVGPSGSGKSTLFRLLLGFEQPEAGSIAYDGFEAAGLDPRSLRRQFGVVLQNSDILPGDIFTNIVGSAVSLTLQDAWHAARLAGLAEDIEAMPMGMHTILSEGAGTISGGQRQRLLIARALVTRPRVVFFDEATSALDNPTQAVVTESLDRLRATRLVVAHRLSTIEHADRIYVLDSGQVVQVGTYEELVSEPGLFLDLVKRQLA